MVIRGLENYGYHELARQIALQHLDRVARVYQSTGTIWENYAPEHIAPGRPAQRDFVGWSGMGPILFLLEYAVGLRPNAPKNELVWDLPPGQRRGCERFRFNGLVVDLLAEPLGGAGGRFKITVQSSGPLTLSVLCNEQRRLLPVRAGRQEWIVPDRSAEQR
jgi:hypothetical protein